MKFFHEHAQLKRIFKANESRRLKEICNADERGLCHRVVVQGGKKSF